jgi:hypothetical protein
MVFLTGAAGAAAVALGVATFRLARHTPRWTATPGAVVLVERRGAAVAFEAHSLEDVESEGENGICVHGLVAVLYGDGGATSPRRTIFGYQLDPGAVGDVGTWLAKAAEIPFRFVRKPYEPPP